MDERLKAIKKYYTDLKYDDDEKKIHIKRLALTKEINDTIIYNSSERFAKTVSIIKENLSFFKAVFKHTDLVTTIIDYLNYYSNKFALNNKYEEQFKKDDRFLLVILKSLLNIYVEYDMRSFFTYALVDPSNCTKTHWQEITRYTTELILLADSDLYAVITYLRKYFMFTFYKYITKIWVQQSIEQKFLWLVKEYLENFSIPICIFRTKKELFTASIRNEINFISIWTEDIVFAKNLATSLNRKRDAVFINTNIDFCNGIILLPYKCHGTLKKCLSSFDDLIKKPSVQKDLVYYFFYDGTWQPPVKETYWIRDECQIANATSYDINKCINSAERGFNIWSSKSITNRMQILSKFVSTLNSNGKCVLANMVSKWINFSYIYDNSSPSLQNQELEMTTIRYPKGVIILKEEDEAILFRRLMQILTVGNSVIVISDTNFCSLVSYCNMFLASEIPPGVINLLSSDNMKKLELSLCRKDYASYAEDIFSEDSFEEIYKKLTIPKQIVMPLK